MASAKANREQTIGGNIGVTPPSRIVAEHLYLAAACGEGRERALRLPSPRFRRLHLACLPLPHRVLGDREVRASSIGVMLTGVPLTPLTPWRLGTGVQAGKGVAEENGKPSRSRASKEEPGNARRHVAALARCAARCASGGCRRIRQ